MLLDLDITQNNLIAGTRYYKGFVPGVPAVLKIPTHRMAVKAAFATIKGIKISRKHRRGESWSEIIGKEIGGQVISKATGPAKKKVARAHVVANRSNHDWKRKNGMGGRGWIDKPGRYPMVIVFHDANRVGPHIDVHIGRVSVIYGLRSKPEVMAKVKYNREGMLTEDSKKALLDHVKAEINNGSRVPQNLDHSVTNGKASWTHGDRGAKGYGSGFSRQIICEEEIDVFKAHHRGPIEFYAPHLNPHRPMYLYQIYPGQAKRAPILIWGMKKHDPPELEDRLHLKLIHPEDEDKLMIRGDMKTSTAKYDGSSCYYVITKKGTTVWGPRISKVTGERIEYTHKVDGIANLTSETTIIGMGELLFKGQDGEYLSAAAGSGILNSNSVVPLDVKPEIRIYRIDKWGRRNVSDLPFDENRALQKEVARMHPVLHVVEKMQPAEAMKKGFEGVVVVPEGGSVNEGFKMKWWDDPDDWQIERVGFFPGSKGGIAGKVYCVSLESGKKFNLGPGQMGDRALCEEMMNNPDRYEGTVLKVNSRRGHEGRAAKVVAIHDDKGFSPV